MSRYRTIVADPPWRYASRDIITRGTRRAASVESGKGAAHYGTMTNAAIAALPVADLCADDAELYLWVTNPLIYGTEGEGITPRDIAEAWGFRFITLLTWIKTGQAGMGFYWRGHTEHVLYAVRGSVRIPPAERRSNVFTAPRGRHSEKPDLFYDLVEQVSPGPYLEMFARRQRLGWDTWGNEALCHVEIGGAA